MVLGRFGRGGMSSISKVVKGALLNLGGLGLPMVVAFFPSLI